MYLGKNLLDLAYNYTGTLSCSFKLDMLTCLEHSRGITELADDEMALVDPAGVYAVAPQPNTIDLDG